jgi:hypothetical protein
MICTEPDTSTVGLKWARVAAGANDASHALWVSRSLPALQHICLRMLSARIFEHWRRSFKYLKHIHQVETENRRLAGQYPSLFQMKYEIYPARLALRLYKINILVDLIKYLTLLAHSWHIDGTCTTEFN